jgi:hypothetical protein
LKRDELARQGWAFRDQTIDAFAESSSGRKTGVEQGINLFFACIGWQRDRAVIRIDENAFILCGAQCHRFVRAFGKTPTVFPQFMFGHPEPKSAGTIRRTGGTAGSGWRIGHVFRHRLY